MSTYSCLLCGQTTPMPHVCPVFAAAESPESRGERPRRGQERRYLTMEEAQRQFGDDPVSLPPQRSDERHDRNCAYWMGDPDTCTCPAGARSGAGAEEALMGKLRAEADRYAEERDAAWAEQDRLSGLLAARESEVTTLRAQLAEARKEIEELSKRRDEEGR